MGSRITLEPMKIASPIAAGGACQKIAISSTSAQSAAITASVVHVTPTVDCFMREAADPTALADGTDHFLLANATQAFVMSPGNKLAFKTSGATGSAYIAPVG